jgi:hypothetical protein
LFKIGKGTLKKKVSSFPVPSRDVTYKNLLGQDLFYYSRPGEILVSVIPAREGKTVKLFLQCREVQDNLSAYFVGAIRWLSSATPSDERLYSL